MTIHGPARPPRHYDSPRPSTARDRPRFRTATDSPRPTRAHGSPRSGSAHYNSRSTQRHRSPRPATTAFDPARPPTPLGPQTAVTAPASAPPLRREPLCRFPLSAPLRRVSHPLRSPPHILLTLSACVSGPVSSATSSAVPARRPPPLVSPGPIAAIKRVTPAGAARPTPLRRPRRATADGSRPGCPGPLHGVFHSPPTSRLPSPDGHYNH